MPTPADRPLHFVDDPLRARLALAAPRPQILQLAHAPISATGVANQLGLPRQRVNYHVRQLARAGFLRRAGRRQRRGLTEQLWVATARAFVLAPPVLGPQAHGAAAADATASAPAAGPAKAGAASLLLLAARMQRELGASARQDEQVPVFAVDAELRFKNSAQRAAFAKALADAVARAVTAHSEPAVPASGRPRGRRFRLLLGCYPTPPPVEEPTS